MSPKATFFLSLALATALGSCARPSHVRLPEAEDYVFPSWPAGELRPDEGRRIERAWQNVLAGKTAEAQTEFQRLLKRRQLVPAEVGLGYARLRAGLVDLAAGTFDAALARQPAYLPALMGAAASARRRGDAESALRLYRRAESVRPEDGVVRKRLAEVRLQVTERRVAAARGALEAGDAVAAADHYRLALEAAPEVSGLRIELARLLFERGDALGGVKVLEADPQQDRQVLGELGKRLLDLKEYTQALEVYRRILSRDPRDADAQRRAREVREAIELLQMPEEYRSIQSAPRLNRAELAALLAVKVTALARVAGREPKVAIDISGSWAREHIVRILALEIMDVYPNHTFQPGAMVRRGDLARAVGRVLDLLGWPASAVTTVKDMSRGHLYYGAVARVVGAGLMDLTAEESFEPLRPVSGDEAVQVIEGLIRLVGP